MIDLGRTILLVDDNDDDVFLFERTLKKLKVGNNVVVLGDGRAAIAYLAGNGKYADRAKYPLPFLVFLDLKMP